MTIHSDLGKILSPTNIALIGASDRALSRGSYIWQSLCQSPMASHAYPVNPKYKYIGERECFAKVADIPVKIDIAIIALRADRVAQSLKEIAQAGIHGVLIATEEADYAQDRHWLEEIQSIVDEYQIDLIGSDSLGIVIPGLGVNASFWPRTPRAGNIALLCQSGLIATSILDYAQEAELGFSGVVTTGAEIGIDLADLIEYYAHDRNTRVIAVQIEGVKNARRLFSALLTASKNKHVVVLKAGDGSGYAADRLASFKYATDAGEDQIFSVFVQQAGAQRVKSFETFTAAISALATNRLPRGSKLAVISNDTGFAALCADAAQGLDVDLHVLSNETIHELQKAYPSPQLPINPIVVGATATSHRYRETLDIVLQDPVIDGVIVIIAPGPTSTIDPTLRYLAKTASGASKPVITAWISDRITRNVRSQLRLVPNAPISAIQSPTNAMEAFAALARRIHIRKERLIPEDDYYPFEDFDPSLLNQIRQKIENARQDGHYVFKDGLFDEILRLLGLESHKNAEQALDHSQACQCIDYLKALRITLKTDHVLGPVIELGPADDQLYVKSNISIGLIPLSSLCAQRMLEHPFIKKYLLSMANQTDQSFDPQILIRFMQRLSVLGALIPAISELRIHHLIWTNSQTALQVINGNLQLNKLAVVPDLKHSHLVICPPDYEDEQNVELKTGQTVKVRPLVASDYSMLLGFIGSLSDKSRYLRFHTTTAISADRICELSKLDYEKEAGWVVLSHTDAGDEIVGCARFGEIAPDEVEFGIVIRDDWQRKGLAKLLMHKIEHLAQQRGYKKVTGFVLRGNEGMHALLTSLSYEKAQALQNRDTDPWTKILL